MRVPLHSFSFLQSRSWLKGRRQTEKLEGNQGIHLLRVPCCVANSKLLGNSRELRRLLLQSAQSIPLHHILTQNCHRCTEQGSCPCFSSTHANLCHLFVLLFCFSVCSFYTCSYVSLFSHSLRLESVLLSSCANLHLLFSYVLFTGSVFVLHICHL